MPTTMLASGKLEGNILHLSGKPAPIYVFYVPGKDPAAAEEEDGGIKIRKPYDGDMPQTYAQNNFSNVRVLKELNEGWLFSPDPQNDGVRRGVIRDDFKDSNWAPISPLDWWQTQGFPDYHGVGWYRLKFDAPALKEGEVAYLRFGAVDGNTIVYLNGKRIGQHLLGANFAGWDKAFNVFGHRSIKPGENTLVVQVTSKDDTSASGIFMGMTLIIGTLLEKK